MANTANEIRLPITIVSDGSKAVAQLEKFKNQAGSIGQKMRTMFKGEAAGVGGMLAGYFGINSALSGLRAIYDYSKKLSETAAMFSAPVAMAQAGAQTEKIKEDQRIAKAISPTEVQRANLAGQQSAESTTHLAEYASAFGLQFEQLSAIVHKGISGTIAALTGDMDGYLETVKKTSALAADAFSLFLPQFAEDFLNRGGMASFFESTPIPQMQTVSDTAAGVAPSQAVGAAMLAELQAINKNSRGRS